MFPLSTLSVLEFSGRDAGQFLHNQLSADINNIGPGEAGFACCCNPAGRVLGLLLVCLHKDSLLAVCASELVEPLKTWLSRFVIRADVAIQLRDDIAIAACIQDDPEGAELVLKTGPGLNYAILPSRHFSEPGDEGQAQSWKVDELKKGIVWLDGGTSAKFLPQMLGFEQIGALSFQKGCFPGQEIIARTRYLGKLKRRPLLVRTANVTPIGVNEKISLNRGETTCSAVVVDRAQDQNHDQYLFVVARVNEAFRPETIKVRDLEIDVLTG